MEEVAKEEVAKEEVAKEGAKEGAKQGAKASASTDMQVDLDESDEDFTPVAPIKKPPTILDRAKEQLDDLVDEALKDPSVKERTRQQVAHASSIFPNTVDTPVILHFCTTCLNRGHQLRTALPINLASCLPFRTTVKFHLVLFTGGSHKAKDYKDLKTWVLTEFQALITMGFLTVAESKKDFWNASMCKNTAHQLGMLAAPKTHIGATVSTTAAQASSSATVSTTPEPTHHVLAGSRATASTTQGTTHVLINLDCDNVIDTEWLLESSKKMHQEIINERKGCWRFSGDDSGCTGRIGVVAEVFAYSRGYDQGLPCPSGYQDIEFAARAGRCTGFGRQSMMRKPWCGYSLPNDQRLKTAQNWAKIANTAPEYQTMTWHQQNLTNMTYVRERVDLSA